MQAVNISIKLFLVYIACKYCFHVIARQPFIAINFAALPFSKASL